MLEFLPFRDNPHIWSRNDKHQTKQDARKAINFPTRLFLSPHMQFTTHKQQKRTRAMLHGHNLGTDFGTLKFKIIYQFSYYKLKHWLEMFK